MSDEAAQMEGSTPRTVYMKKMIAHWGSRDIPRYRRNAILKMYVLIDIQIPVLNCSVCRAVIIQHRNRHKAESRTLKWLIQLTFMAPRLEEMIFQKASLVRLFVLSVRYRR
jgi:hypothetical protein